MRDVPRASCIAPDAQRLAPYTGPQKSCRFEHPAYDHRPTLYLTLNPLASPLTVTRWLDLGMAAPTPFIGYTRVDGVAIAFDQFGVRCWRRMRGVATKSTLAAIEACASRRSVASLDNGTRTLLS